MGMLSFALALTIMIIVILYRKKWKYLTMLAPVFGVGLLILPLGLTLFVKSTFPAYVFYELILLFVKITKAKKIIYVRLVIDFIGISMGLIIGFFLTIFMIKHSVWLILEA
jgi:hypothetical protein